MLTDSRVPRAQSRTLAIASAEDFSRAVQNPLTAELLGKTQLFADAVGAHAGRSWDSTMQDFLERQSATCPFSTGALRLAPSTLAAVCCNDEFEQGVHAPGAGRLGAAPRRVCRSPVGVRERLARIA